MEAESESQEAESTEERELVYKNDVRKQVPEDCRIGSERTRTKEVRGGKKTLFQCVLMKMSSFVVIDIDHLHILALHRHNTFNVAYPYTQQQFQSSSAGCDQPNVEHLSEARAEPARDVGRVQREKEQAVFTAGSPVDGPRVR